MNKYYYVSVMDENITCNGDSFREILKTADHELFEKCASEKDKSKVRDSFREKHLPHKIVIVDNGGCSYELATEASVDVISKDSMIKCEISGFDVVDVFVENPNYSDDVFNMMERYYRNISSKKKKVKMKK